MTCHRYSVFETLMALVVLALLTTTVFQSLRTQHAAHQREVLRFHCLQVLDNSVELLGNERTLSAESVEQHLQAEWEASIFSGKSACRPAVEVQANGLALIVVDAKGRPLAKVEITP